MALLAMRHSPFALKSHIMLSTQQGQILLKLARTAIASHFSLTGKEIFANDWLLEPAATFVTLTEKENLRGCIGTLEAYRPLREDVHENALAAAFRDPRFPPLTYDELGAIRIEVSLLSPPEPMSFKNEEDALAQLHPHVDGIVLAAGFHRATFLPQVWEQLPEPRDFMLHLMHKAGLLPGHWPHDMKLSRYTVSKWKE